MMYENKKEIEKIYVLLCGTYKAIKESSYDFIQKESIDQYNGLIKKLFDITKDDYINLYYIEYFECRPYENGSIDCRKDVFLLKILPILEYLEKIYADSKEETIQKIGALYNSIIDIELQKRCGDILLESTEAFDRVINQATQILEDRIKKKSNLQSTMLIGLPLVSKAIHSKLENTILKFSNKQEIQEQYAALFKGVIGVYRNSTHHGLDYECSREEALKFCAYIDLLLNEVDRCEIVEKNNLK